MAAPSQPKSPIYLFAFIHLIGFDLFFLPCAFGLLFPLSGNPIVALSFPDMSQVIGNDVDSGGLGLFLFQFVWVLLFFFALGYYGLYRDGPAAHPVPLVSGALGKAWAAYAFLKGYREGYFGPLMTVNTVIEAVLSFFFLRDWVRLGYTLTPAAVIKRD